MTAAARPVSASWKLEVDGAPASPALLGSLQRLEVEDHADKADMLRLRFAVGVREDGSGWRLLDDDVFPRLARLRLSVTIGSRSAIPLIEAYVVETRAELSSTPGGSLLSVVAMDPTILMHLEERVRAWPNLADSDVATQIFQGGAYGFDPVVDTTTLVRAEEEHTLLQRGTDIQFLRRLAERNGFECYVELDPRSGRVQGHFHAPRLAPEPQGTLTLGMGTATNVDRLTVRHDMLGAVSADAAGVDADQGSTDSSDATESGEETLGATPITPGDRPRRMLLGQLGMGQGSEYQRYAQAVVDRSTMSIVAEGELNTAAYGGLLRAKRPVLVRGVGTALGGKYYVERVLHLFTDAGYTQRFTLRRNAVGVPAGQRFGRGGDDA